MAYVEARTDRSSHVSRHGFTFPPNVQEYIQRTTLDIMRPSQEETNSLNACHPLRVSFSIPPKAGRGCHFFIYDNDVERRGPAIAKTVSALCHPRRCSYPSGHCFNPFEENNGNIECLYVETLFPTQSSPTMISLKGPDRPTFDPIMLFFPTSFQPQSLQILPRGLFPGSQGSAYVSSFF